MFFVFLVQHFSEMGERKKNANSFADTAKATARAHTLLGPSILMLRLVDQTLCFDQLYSCTVIMLSILCTPVRHFVVTSAHTLLGPVCSTT